MIKWLFVRERSNYVRVSLNPLTRAYSVCDHGNSNNKETYENTKKNNLYKIKPNQIMKYKMIVRFMLVHVMKI